MLDPSVADPGRHPGRSSTPRRARSPTVLPYGQSLLLIWPQIVGLIAGTVICFALAYVAFMRQEVRA